MIGDVLEDCACLDKGTLPGGERGIVEQVGLGPLNHFYNLVVDTVPHDVDEEVRVVAYIILSLDHELLESSHKVLNCLLSLLKGEEAFFCISSDI